MNDHLKWNIVFKIFNNFMKSNVIMHDDYHVCSFAFLRTAYYWKMDHLKCLMEMGFMRSMSDVLFRAYYRLQHTNKHILQLVGSLSKIFYVIQKQQNIIDHFERELVIQIAVNIFTIPMKNLKARKNLHQKILSCKHTINEFLTRCDISKQVLWKDDLSMVSPDRACGNNECSFDYLQNHKKIRLKICKGCKMIYYCSRCCQKINWKRVHRRHCGLLKNVF